MSGSVGRRFVVRGLVQGVGYRAFARRVAVSLSVSGYARNLPDGTVEVVAVGSVENIALLESALRRGPTYGSVDEVSAAEIGPQLGAHKSFDIR